MDDYMFRSYVANFKCVQEATSYLEIFNYSVSCPVFFLALERWEGSETGIAYTGTEEAGRRRRPSQG